MTKTKPFTKASAKAFRKDLQAVLDKHAALHGYEEISMGNISYGEYELTTKITVKKKVDDTTASSQIDEKAVRVNLPKGLYGRTFTYQGEDYVIVDINTRAPKYPIVFEDRFGNRRRGARSMLEQLN